MRYIKDIPTIDIDKVSSLHEALRDQCFSAHTKVAGEFRRVVRAASPAFTFPD